MGISLSNETARYKKMLPLKSQVQKLEIQLQGKEEKL